MVKLNSPQWITPQVANLIGTSPPRLLTLTSASITSQLASKSLDIGMCGYLITLNRSIQFDFTPFYMPSGFQAVIKKATSVPSMGDVFFFIFSTIDGKAQLIFLFLLVIIFIYGHLISLAENVAYSGTQNIRTGYFEATMDGMWLAINQLSTVGYVSMSLTCQLHSHIVSPKSPSTIHTSSCQLFFLAARPNSTQVICCISVPGLSSIRESLHARMPITATE